VRSPAAGAATRTEKSTTLPPAPHPERRNPPPCCRPPPEQRNPPPCRRRCTPNREIRSPNRDSATARQTHGRYGGRPDPGLRTTQRLPPQRAGDRAHMLRRCPSGNPRMQKRFSKGANPRENRFFSKQPRHAGANPAKPARPPRQGVRHPERPKGAAGRGDPEGCPKGATQRSGRMEHQGETAATAAPARSRYIAASAAVSTDARPACSGRSPTSKRFSSATPSVR